MARIPGNTAERTLDTSPGVTLTAPKVDPAAAAIADIGGSVANAGARILYQENQQAQKLENFKTEQAFVRFQTEQSEVLKKRVQEAPDGLPDLAAGFEKDVIVPKSAEFLNNTVPERLRPEYDERIKTWREKAAYTAAETEYTGRNAYFKSTIEKSVGEVAAGVNLNPDNLSQARDSVFNQIDNTTLPSAEREALKSRYGLVIANAAIDGLVKANRFDDARTLSTTIAGTNKEAPGAIDNEGKRGDARNAIIKASNDAGFDPQTAIMVSHLEAGLNPDAANPKSTARGLFQFREKERQQRGLDENATVEQQAQAGVALLKERAAELTKAGIQPTPFNLYMAHFQGVGGAKALLKADGSADLEETLDAVRPGWKNKDGKGYGEVVMDANNLDDMTVGEFRSKIEKRVTGGMVAASLGGLGWHERKAIESKTETLIEQKENDDKKENRETARRTAAKIQDDLASISATGKELVDPDLTENRVSELLGKDKAAAWMQQREAARRLHAQTSDFESIPATEIEERLAKLAPEAGKEGFATAQEAYELAAKKATKVLKMREDDPANAVNNDPDVLAARKAYNPQQPNAGVALVEARLAAQERVGLPALARSPVTNAEARSLGAGLEGGLPTQTRERIEGLLTGLQATYGKHADEVLVAVMGQVTKNKELAEQVAGMAKKFARGQQPAVSDAVKLDTTTDAANASRGMSGFDMAQVALDQQADAATAANANFTSKREIPEFKPKQPITAEAIRGLLDDPATAPAFDETYGSGAAAHVKAWDQKIFQEKNKRAKPNG